MDSPNNIPYIVKETDCFLQQIEVLLSIKNWDEIKMSFDLDLARKPRAGNRILSMQLYAITIPAEPALTVYYAINDEEQALILMEVHPCSDGGRG